MQGRYSKIWSLSCVWRWACLPYSLKIFKQHYNLNGKLVSHLNSSGDMLVALRTRRHLPSSVPSSTTTWLIRLEPISKQVEYWGPLGQKWHRIWARQNFTNMRTKLSLLKIRIQVANPKELPEALALSSLLDLLGTMSKKFQKSLSNLLERYQWAMFCSFCTLRFSTRNRAIISFMKKSGIWWNCGDAGASFSHLLPPQGPLQLASITGQMFRFFSCSAAPALLSNCPTSSRLLQISILHILRPS